MPQALLQDQRITKLNKLTQKKLRYMLQKLGLLKAIDIHIQINKLQFQD